MKRRLLGSLAALALVLLLVATVLPAVAQEGGDASAAGKVLDLPPLELRPKGNPRLDSSLNRLAAAETSEQAIRLAQEGNIRLSDGNVRVIIEALPGQVDAAMQAAASIAVIETSHGDSIQALVPISQLTALAESPGVRYVRTPWYPIPAVVSEGVGLINADDWHAAGYTGEGVKVAILDGGFTGYADLLGTELPDTVVTQSFYAGSDIEGYSVHGTACAEVVHDVAPGAELYLVNFGTSIEMANAVDWLVAQGVDVISYSMGWPTGGPGDGTGFICAMVDYAHDNGILWVNSIGNQAQRHWQGDLAYDGTTMYHEFSSDDWGNEITATEGQTIAVSLRWNDEWGLSGNDIDLYLYGDGNHDLPDNVVATSVNAQGGDDYPIESLSVIAPYSGTYHIAIFVWPGQDLEQDPPVQLHLYTFYHDLEYQISEGSFLVPSDSPNALSVGAVPWNAPDTLEYFSSRGPTDDGRTKPDLAAPDGVDNATYTKFYGTSAACPHVAGAAALVLQRYPSYSPSEVQSLLEDRAIDLGTGGKDNLFGSGRLHLRSPADLAVSTGDASGTTGSSAVLNGTLHGLGADLSVHVSFVWGPEPQTDPALYASETSLQAMTGAGSLSTVIEGLSPNTTYYYRAKAAGSTTVYGDELSFTTLAPDLIVSEKHEEWVGGQEDVQYTVFFTMQNAGTADAPAGHDVGLSVDGVAQGEQIEVTQALAPGETFSGSFATVVDLTGDFDEVQVCADVNAEVGEQDEENSCRTNFWPLAEVTVDLVYGWNIVALSAIPPVTYTASTLAAEINAQGGSVSEIFWWNADAGAWDFWLVDIEYGTDFNIEVGYGYLLSNSKASTWTYWGSALPTASAQVPVLDGWNLPALPVQPAADYTASTMAAEINGQGGDVSEVFWWNATAGTWDFWLVDVQYGTDFSVELGEGHLLKNATECIWTIQGE